MGKLRHIAAYFTTAKSAQRFLPEVFRLRGMRKVFPSGSRMVIDPLFNLAFLQQAAVSAAISGTHRADGSEAELTVRDSPLRFHGG